MQWTAWLKPLIRKFQSSFSSQQTLHKPQPGEHNMPTLKERLAAHNLSEHPMEAIADLADRLFPNDAAKDAPDQAGAKGKGKGKGAAATE